MSIKKRGLGRGLDALLATSSQASSVRQQQEQASQQTPSASGPFKYLPIEFLTPGKYQPRKDMTPEALEELAQSIRVQGIIQPVLVRPLSKNLYEIIAGERRWRAAQLAQLSEIPCLVQELSDHDTIAIALIENIQREDLNPMEEALAYQRLVQEFDLTHQEVSEAVGKSRTTITNLLRLTQLNDDVKLMLETGDIDLGHAKVLLAIQGEEQSLLAQQVVEQDLTVRETEQLIKQKDQPAKKQTPKETDPNITHLENKLAEQLGAKVSVQHNNKGKGKLVIHYTNLDELDGILGFFEVE